MNKYLNEWKIYIFKQTNKWGIKCTNIEINEKKYMNNKISKWTCKWISEQTNKWNK